MHYFGVKLVHIIPVFALVLGSAVTAAGPRVFHQCLDLLDRGVYHLDARILGKYPSNFRSLKPMDPMDSEGYITSSAEVAVTPESIIEAFMHGAYIWRGAEGLVTNRSSKSRPLGWYRPPMHGLFHVPLIAERKAKVHVPEELHEDYDRIVGNRKSLMKHLRQAHNKLENRGWIVTFNQAFRQVVKECAEHKRPNYNYVWLTQDVQDTYYELFKQGKAFSVEVWDAEGRLIGGTYGLNLDGFIGAESLFDHESDAGKVALISLADLLYPLGIPVIDTMALNDNSRNNYPTYELPVDDWVKMIGEIQEDYIERGRPQIFPSLGEQSHMVLHSDVGMRLFPLSFEP